MENIHIARLLIISNRLPLSIEKENDQMLIRLSSGGLVSAIRSYFSHEEQSTDVPMEKVWIGLADFSEDDWQNKAVSHFISQLNFKIIPFFIDKDLYQDYYNGFSNSVIWPLFHYFSSIADFRTSFLDAYVKVNEFFASQLSEILQPDDIIWIHDYHLLLLPGLIRNKHPHASIGFFLHIPFPAYETFRLLPRRWKKMILEGMLGADIIGFHTHDYVQHFIQSARIILGIENHFYQLEYKDRLLKADLFPISIDYQGFRQNAKSAEVEKLFVEIKQGFSGKKIIFSVDRLDYTKGLMERLDGFEYFLSQYPEWKENLVFVFNIVPSRNEITEYSDRKSQMEEKIGNINGKFSTIAWQPIVYRYTHMEFNEMVALYRAADVALITPLRDGMNLVAKEFVACCISKKGVLILSELAGAANELSEALLVNPTDVEDVATSIQTALKMPVEEQVRRLSIMQKRLEEYDVVRWVKDFLEQLAEIKREQLIQAVKLLDENIIRKMILDYKKAKSRCLLLDYDGTLAPIARAPKDAIPDQKLRDILSRLASDMKNTVVIISGREANTLDQWFADIPLTLVAEHGACIRKPAEDWQFLAPPSQQWKNEIRNILRVFQARCIGSFVEEKTYSLAWHYRNTPRDLGFIRSRELVNNLSHLLQNTSLQVVQGNKVIEVRMSGFDKGIIATNMVTDLNPEFILSMGDDTTDEDMFRALQNKAYTIKVSSGATDAHNTLPSQLEVLPLLNRFLER